MEEGSSKMKKRKRGRSLIFKLFLPLTGSGDDNNAHASDDNLVYCDISNNGTNGDASTKTKSASSRGRMSTIFKAVLFDTAMKKRVRGKKGSKTTTAPPTNSLVLDEKTDSSSNENNTGVVKVSNADNNSKVVKVSEADNSPNVVKVSEADNCSNVVKILEAVNNPNTVKVSETDNNPNNVKVSESNNNPNAVKVLEVDNNSSNESSNVVSLPPKTDASLMASSAVDTGSQMPTERKVMSRVNLNDKKPPLPYSRSSVKPIVERESNPDTLNNSTSRLCLFIVLVVFVSVVLWVSFRTTITKSSNLDSGQYGNTVVVRDEL